MPEFVDGEEFTASFLAAAGWITLAAKVIVRGDTVILSNLDYRPLHTKVLRIPVRETLMFEKQVLAHARSQGYTTVVFEGERTTGRNPFRAIRYERRTR
jgi:hypothetical protein